jgi:Protein of unknown function (DUF3108)/LysM domain
LKKRSPLPFIGLLLFLGVALQGCSLLFVAQGETRYVPSSWKSSPQTASLESQMAAAPAPRIPNEKSASGLKYQVKKGDSLWKLSRRFYGKGFDYGRIVKANGIDAQHPFKVGTWLTLFVPTQGQSEAEKNQRSSSATPGPQATPAADEVDADTTPIPVIARPRVNKAFAPGERLKFEVRALSVLGGYATLQVGGPVTVEGRPCLSLSALANSAFPFSAVYPVSDVQTSYFDAVDFLTWKFENNVLEGGYKARNQELYHQLQHQMVRRHNNDGPVTMSIPPFTQDIISCFYYFRLLDLKVGGRYAIPTTSGGKNYQLVIDVLGRETITVPAGTFDCLKVKPFVKYDTVFRNKEDIELWVTADARHVPVLIQSAIVIGNISIALLDATLPDMN